jgi:thiol:disulfide interchange protein
MRIRSLRNGLTAGLAVLTLALSCSVTALAQGETLQDLLDLTPKGRGTAKPKFVTTLTAALGKTVATLKSGDEVTLTVSVTLPDGYYIYGTDGKFGGRTVIKLEANGLDEIDADWAPDREPKRLFEPLLAEEVSKFHDRVTWKKKLRLKDGTDPTQLRVTGELTGQYCSEGKNGEGQCIPIIPPHEFEVALADGGVATSGEATPAARFDYEALPKSKAKPPERLRFQLSPTDAGPGDKVQLSVTIEMDEGWHTFSLTHDGIGGVKTEINVTDLVGLKPTGEGFVADHPFEIEKPEADITLEVHNARVTWTREYEVLASVEPGRYGAAGEITYQVCKKSCIQRRLEFALGHVASANSTPTTPTNAATPHLDESPKATATGQARAGGVVAKRPQDQGLVAFLLTAIGVGLVSLLTPCVFPMVPITVSFFLKQSESQHNKPLLMALVFCGAIVGTFTVLGVGIAAIFGAAQLNALANNPWLNVAIGIVFVAFAFNMLGLFEIRIPAGLLTFTSNQEAAGGYLGAAFMALTFTLTSFTCTFAFAGSLLVAAAQGQYYWPILGMMAFGAAFASPFFLLALVPSMLKKLPKSGGWMNSVKVVMGLIELAAAVKFFSVADLAWNSIPVMFDFTGAMVAWTVLSVSISLYLLGVYRLDHDTPVNSISVGRLTIAMAFLGFAGMLTVGLLAPERGGGWIMDQIVAFAPPRFEEPVAHGPPAVAGASSLPTPTITHHGIQFAMDVDKAIAFATQENRPMLFDFTGVNCINCRLMEKKLAQPEIRQRLDRLVLVQLYADKVPLIPDAAEAKRLLKRNVGLQTEWFGDVTLPSYAVVTPDGKTILSSYFGLEQKDGEFAAFLDEGWKKWQAAR